MGLLKSKTKSKTVGSTKARASKTKKAATPKKNNFQKWLAYMKKYPPGSTPSVDSNTILVTARKRSGAYVPDRTFAELETAYNSNVFPLLRVIGDKAYFCPLADFDGNTFVFEGALRIEETLGTNEKKLISWRFCYTRNGFTDESKTFVNTPVDIEIEPI